uniref:Uncharacterized protein n=1 Tax=Alexandrium monilatum TaxID=311494 RepID=A0A7S4SYL4_9DINO
MPDKGAAAKGGSKKDRGSSKASRLKKKAKAAKTAGAKGEGQGGIGSRQGRHRDRNRGRQKELSTSAYWELLEANEGEDNWPELEVDAATAELEAIVFGRRPEAADSKDAEAPSAPGEPRKKKRRKGAEAGEEEEEEAEAEEGEKEAPAAKTVWEDPDDVEMEVELNSRVRLRKMKRDQAEEKISGVEYVSRQREWFVKLHGSTPQWAAATAEAEASGSESEAETPAVPSSRRLAAPRRDGALQPTEISVKILKEVSIIPGQKKGPAIIRALQFHPESTLLLTAGMDKTLRLFAADGEENPKVASCHFKDFPILEASFMQGGNKVLLTGEKKHMWGLDVPTGEPFKIKPLSAQVQNRYFGLTPGPEPSEEPGLKSSKMFVVLGDLGTVMVGDLATLMPIRTLRMASPGVATAFAPGRDALYTADSDCNIYEWDLGTGRCRKRIKEPWATGITCLATSRATQRHPRSLLAVGTPSGNIDMFDVGGEKMPREPFKNIDNLTTSVTGIRFHSSGELCAGFSVEKKDQLRLIHTPTMTVFKNWPANTCVKRVSAHSFAKSGGLMAVGNDSGRVFLYQLNHYEVDR